MVVTRVNWVVSFGANIDDGDAAEGVRRNRVNRCAHYQCDGYDGCNGGMLKVYIDVMNGFETKTKDQAGNVPSDVRPLR